MLEVFRLDLKTHATREMFSTPVPAGVRCACYPTIHHDFVALQVELTSDDQPPPAIDAMNKRSRVIIINWREGTYILLDGLFSQKVRINVTSQSKTRLNVVIIFAVSHRKSYRPIRRHWTWLGSFRLRALVFHIILDATQREYAEHNAIACTH